MKKILLIITLLCSFVFSEDLLKNETRLVADGKGVIFIFESDNCPYCKLLKKDFNENKHLKELAKNFNIYLLNIEKEQDYIVGKTKKKESTTTLRLAFSSKSTPNIVMFDKHWNKIFQLPGYAHPAQMITFMTFIKGLQDGKYKANEWQKYLKANGVS